MGGTKMADISRRRYSLISLSSWLLMYHLFALGLGQPETNAPTGQRYTHKHFFDHSLLPPHIHPPSKKLMPALNLHLHQPHRSACNNLALTQMHPLGKIGEVAPIGFSRPKLALLVPLKLAHCLVWLLFFWFGSAWVKYSKTVPRV